MNQTEAFAEAADWFENAIAMVTGHRERAKAAGFSDAAAEQMAVQVHALLVRFLDPTVHGGKQRE